jgi:hypothetical protein
MIPLRGRRRYHIGFLLLLVSLPLCACEYPEEGNMPLRRAVSKVRELPETQAWAKEMHERGVVVQYALRLDRPSWIDRRCYWPVDVNADGTTWKRFYVTPDGRALRRETADRRPRAGR